METIKPLLWALVLLLLGTCRAHAAEPLPRVLILTGSGPSLAHGQQYPPWVHAFQNDEVARILADSVQVQVSGDLVVLDPARLAGYDVVVSNSLFLTPTPSQLAALEAYVTGGGALLTLHSGLLSFLNAPFYEQMMGGIFIGGPSTEPETFEVATGNMEFWYYGYAFRPSTGHPVSAAVEDFSTTDELYYFQPTDPAIEVIARAQNHPVMWERRWGRGRVMGLVLGHDLRAKQNPGYRALLRSGVRWLVGYPLLRPLPDVRLDAAMGPVRDLLRLQDGAGVRDGAPLAFSVIGNDNPGLADLRVERSGQVSLTPGQGEGVATVTIQARSAAGLASTGSFTVSVDRDRRGNLAAYHGVRATASASEARRDVGSPSNLVDGDLRTRWASAQADPAWVVVDLGRTCRFSQVVLHWQDAFAAAYALQVSDDPARGWRTVHAERDGAGGVETVAFAPLRARYLRLLGQRRALPRWGYSLHEIEVYNR